MWRHGSPHSIPPHSCFSLSPEIRQGQPLLVLFGGLNMPIRGAKNRGSILTTEVKEIYPYKNWVQYIYQLILSFYVVPFRDFSALSRLTCRPVWPQRSVACRFPRTNPCPYSPIPLAEEVTSPVNLLPAGFCVAPSPSHLHLTRQLSRQTEGEIGALF